jgi:hypothetical protein
MCFTNPATEAEKTDEQQDNLADLIDGDNDQTDPDADDGVTSGDDLAALIGDGPDDGNEQQEGDVDAGQLEHHNDDAVTDEIVAAE